MSEFDKENTFDSAEKNEGVEAFDDFEMSIDDTEDSAEPVEVFDEIEDVMAAVEAVEEVESIREDEFDRETSEESVEAVEEVEDDEEPAEADEAVEDDEEPAETDEAVEEDEEPIEAVEKVEDDEEEEIDIMSAVAALDACADNQYDSAEIISEEEFLSDTPEVVDDESAQTEDDSEKSEDAEESDEDDYLDYDDIPRPKKTVSGKTALITMLVTGIVTICLIVGAVILGIICKKDTGVSVISYSDKFNACDTNSFSLGQMMGAGLVSMSDAECSLSNEEITALKKGKTVTKFNKMLNLKADTRFGKIVSMDISFNSELNEQKESGITCMMLLGNAMSGFMDNIDSSDQAFITAYKILVEGSYPALEKGDRVYVYKTDDIAVYSDYSKMTESNDFSALTVHIENKDPKYIDTEKLDFSWLPFDFSSDKKSDNGTSVSASDN